jgi:PAS domain S-box-containing protein
MPAWAGYLAGIGCPLVALWLTSVGDLPSGTSHVLLTAIISWIGWQFGVRSGLLGLAVAAVGFIGVSQPSRETAVTAILFVTANAFVLSLVHSRSQTRQELVSSRMRFSFAADLIPFGSWLADRNGNMLEVSPSFLKAFDTTQEACQGLGWADLVIPEERAALLEAWRDCVGKSSSWDRTYRMTGADGIQKVVLSRGVPLFSADRRVESWVGIHLDVTEREEMTKRRNQQDLEIARFHAEVDQFSYIAAHDLQEPLRMIASYVQLLAKRYQGKLDADADEFIGFAVEGSNRLRTLLQNLQTYTQIGKFPHRRRKQNLSLALKHAIENCNHLIRNAGATIEEGPLPVLTHDEVEMTMLFEHLIDNAIKFRSDDAAPHIRVDSVKDGGTYVISVSDNGIGIEPEYQKRIFELFQRLNAREIYGGTGLGLAVAKKIVETHHGQIGVTSSLGEGATFHFRLPDQ